MSCIVVSVERVGNPIQVASHRIGSPMELDVRRVGAPAEVTATKIGAPMVVSASRIGKPMEVSCRLVCTINGEFYLRVSPEVIWLNPNDATVFVESNVNWNIE